MDLNGKKILITGGARGIGLELLQLCVDAGAQVAICGRNEQTIDQARMQLDRDILGITADISDPGTPQFLHDRIQSEWNGLDILINNAAIQQSLDFINDSSDQLLEKIADEFTIDLIAPVKICAALMPLLKRSDDAMIVNISSGLALAPKAAAPVYCSAKAGLSSFSRSLRYQTEKDAPHIKVADVILPIVATDMTAGRGNNKMTASGAAQSIVNGIRREKQTIHVGIAKLFAWIMRIVPSLGFRILRGT